MSTAKLSGVVLLLVALSVAACSSYAPAYQFSASKHTVDSPFPVFENKYVTDHFILKWTNRSRDSRDNIADQQVIKDTAGYLETAWSKYNEVFGRKPFTPPGKDKIEVVFRDMDCYGVADPPDGPIQFNSYAWVTTPGIRKPTSAHELFHKVQYAYGYKTKWHPQKPYMWFTEGTAAWSEVFVWGRVSRGCKVDEIFKNTRLDLYQADDMAMPFWIYFVQGNQQHPNNELMVKLLERCEQYQDEKRALNEVIKETYGSVDQFYKSFNKDRKNGFWSSTCDAPYSCILGPDGKDMVEEVKGIQKRDSRGRS